MTEEMPAPQRNDVELVAESLHGNQDAFRQIVERYQTLICALAYCATGSLNQSEDLAQETFIQAFQQLSGYQGKARFSSSFWFFCLPCPSGIATGRRTKLTRFKRSLQRGKAGKQYPTGGVPLRL